MGTSTSDVYSLQDSDCFLLKRKQLPIYFLFRRKLCIFAAKQNVLLIETRGYPSLDFGSKGTANCLTTKRTNHKPKYGFLLPKGALVFQTAKISSAILALYSFIFLPFHIIDAKIRLFTEHQSDTRVNSCYILNQLWQLAQFCCGCWRLCY